MPIDLEKLERLHKAATPGPWEVRKDKENWRGARYEVETHKGRPVGYVCNWNSKVDAAYIVAACNALPDLIAENRELRERGRELKKQRDYLAKLLGDLCTTQKDGDCPLFYACPASGFGWSCGNAIKEDWIYTAEQAAKETGE